MLLYPTRRRAVLAATRRREWLLRMLARGVACSPDQNDLRSPPGSRAKHVILYQSGPVHGRPVVGEWPLMGADEYPSGLYGTGRKNIARSI